MIITQDNPNIQRVPAASGQLPPPPYGTTPTYALLPRPGQEYRRSPSARFFHAFVLAVLIWLLFSFLTGSIVELGRWDHWGHAGWGETIPADVRVTHCAEWVPEHAPGGSYPYAAGADFTLPVAEAISVFSRGSMASGSLTAVPSAEVGDEVRVHVSVRYHSEELRNRASACLARRPGDDVDGVGIFTPARWPWHGGPHTTLSFAVTVTFPAHARGPLPITRFSTDLANYAHALGALRGAVDFGAVALRATNGAVEAEALAAGAISVQTTNAAVRGEYAARGALVVRTTNGAIAGAYNASAHLALRTTNGAIDARVALAHGAQEAPAALVLETTNGPLAAATTLTRTSDADTGPAGAFDVRARTTNERLALAFPEPALPAGARLTLRAHTTNGPARVEVPAAFAGAFALATTNGAPAVEDRALPDPAGRGRRRVVSVVERGKRVIRGRLAWGESAEGGGEVDVATTNGRATLVV